MKKTKTIVHGLDATNPANWLNLKGLSDELKEQLKNMSKKELKIAFSRKQLAFGTAGIRAKMGPGTQYLNKFVYQQMMIGYCKYILSKKYHNPTILIAHDNRMYSDEFAMECAKVAQKMGVDAYLMGQNKLLPTPILSYAIRKNKFHGGVNITASHNPKEDNGFKAYNQLGAQVLPEEAAVIVKNMPESKEILDLSKHYEGRKEGQILYLDYDLTIENFFDDLIRATVIDKTFLVPSAPIKNFPIVFTGFHGTTTELLPKLLKQIGFKKIYVYPKHASIDGKFANCPISNPENPKAFNDILKFATEKKATVIIGCDPDGDRVAMGFKKTNRWRFLKGNEMGAIFAHYLITKRPYTKTPLIITTHVSSSFVDRIAAKHKAEVMRTKTGFKWLSNMIDSLPEKYQFVLGFEEAIGALPHDICRDKDAFGTVLLALEILNHGNAYFVDLHDYVCDRLYDVYGPTFTETYSYTINADDWQPIAKKLMYRALRTKEKKLFDYTIQKAWYQREADAVVWTLDKDSWIKFRISGTEPKFKVYFNFNNEMAGQLKAAAVMNIAKIENTILKGIDYSK